MGGGGGGGGGGEGDLSGSLPLEASIPKTMRVSRPYRPLTTMLSVATWGLNNVCYINETNKCNLNKIKNNN